MEAILDKFGLEGQDDIELWVQLIDRIRPRQAGDTEQARQHLASLCATLCRREDVRIRLRDSLIDLFETCKVVSLYVSSGLLPSTGFFSETARRISGRVLPEVIDTSYMKGVIGVVFPRVDDEVWVNAIPDAEWITFIELVFAPDEQPESPARGDLPGPIVELVEALRVLSYHVSSIGLDPELVRIDPTLEEHESPFLAQNAELVAYLADYKEWWNDPDTRVADEKHLGVMLDQCNGVVQRIRRKAAKIGTSLSLTFKLERLQQHLNRINSLLQVLFQLREQRDLSCIAPNIVVLMKELIRAECRKNKLSDYWGKNVELLSLRMTESASRTGEHYIASNRSEYFGILRSAALGGLIISLMAALKIVLGWQGFAPLNSALGICLNYGIGFALIHILGGTVATKQPAMTANAIAASISEAKGKTRNLDNLVELIVRTVRSQVAAIAGNVGIAVPMAMLIGAVVLAMSGEQFILPEQAHYMLGEVDPLGGTVLFAAIAGVCLFLSGLIAGYYDNLCAYGRIPQRLYQLRWPRRVFGEARMQRVSDYVENNLGALAGNFLFGFLLGGVTTLGVLFGLPLDIRHIAFSSAYVGYATVGLEFNLPTQLALMSALGVLLIGITNLSVSFALTLSVAMRARKITFAQGQDLLRLIVLRFVRNPFEFFLPPPKEPSQALLPAPQGGNGNKPADSERKPGAPAPAPDNTLGSTAPKG